MSRFVPRMVSLIECNSPKNRAHQLQRDAVPKNRCHTKYILVLADKTPRSLAVMTSRHQETLTHKTEFAQMIHSVRCLAAYGIVYHCCPAKVNSLRCGATQHNGNFRNRIQRRLPTAKTDPTDRQEPAKQKDSGSINRIADII